MSERGLEQRFLAACAVAREAGELARRHFQSDALQNAYKLKGAQDYWTAADGEVEQLIIKRLSEAFPDDTFYGEEGGGRFGAETWVIDPIDGTANFARGIAHFCISIGFLRDGAFTLGAICDPIRGELFAASRGAGATCNGRPLRVSQIDNLKTATVEIGWSSRRTMHDYLGLVEQVMSTGAAFRRAGSGALGLAYVAAGRSDGYCELHINSWDVAAGLILVEEAGGWTNSFLANDGLTRGNPVLATTPALKDALLAAAPSLGI